jgi:hypothetical protein
MVESKRWRFSGPFKNKRMKTIHAEVPDPLARQIEELAKQEKLSVDQWASIALAHQVSASLKRDTVIERAKRGSWEKFDSVMGKVRDVASLPGDEK